VTTIAWKPSATRRLLAGATSGLVLAGCVVGPDYRKPDTPVPTEFRGATTTADPSSIADLPWWGVFNDPQLQALISEGLANNHDLRIAVSRIEQARAQLAAVRSQAYPQLNYNTFIAGEKSFVPEVGDVVGTSEFGSIGGALQAAWEFDVWGRIRRSAESAQANLLAQEDVRRGVLLTLVTDIANGYFRLLELDRELAIAQESSGIYKQQLGFFTDRFNAGRDTRLPVDRTQADYDASTAKIHEVQLQIAQQENALNVLVGGYPRAIPRGRPLIDQTMPSSALGSTSALLQRRPDILEAEQRMIQANAEIGVAIANYFPRVGLSALGGGVGAYVNDNWEGFSVWRAAIGASGPIFTGGLLTANEANRRAFWNETVAQYQKIVVRAFQETSDALVAQQTLAQRRTALESQVAALRRSSGMAMDRYTGGRASYFEVLEAQQQLFPAEDALARTQRDQLVAVVNLYKSLGGGWNLAPPQWAQPAPVAGGSQ
jgi:multidrug efflux system outer membrane protein